jgi:hypothetical protein
MAQNDRHQEMKTMQTSYLPAAAAGIVVLTLAGAAEAAAVPPVVQSRAFFEGLAFGETVLIVRNGPISVEAKCEGNIEAPFEPDVFIDRISLIASTTVPGVVGDLDSSNFPDFEGKFLDPDTPEDNRRMFHNAAFPSETPEYDNDIDEGSLIAPSGEVILIDGEILGLGLNIFGVDCLVAGTYYAFKGRF